MWYNDLKLSWPMPNGTQPKKIWNTNENTNDCQSKYETAMQPIYYKPCFAILTFLLPVTLNASVLHAVMEKNGMEMFMMRPVWPEHEVANFISHRVRLGMQLDAQHFSSYADNGQWPWPAASASHYAWACTVPVPFEWPKVHVRVTVTCACMMQWTRADVPALVPSPCALY